MYAGAALLSADSTESRDARPYSYVKQNVAPAAPKGPPVVFLGAVGTGGSTFASCGEESGGDEEAGG